MHPLSCLFVPSDDVHNILSVAIGTSLCGGGSMQLCKWTVLLLLCTDDNVQY